MLSQVPPPCLGSLASTDRTTGRLQDSQKLDFEFLGDCWQRRKYCSKSVIFAGESAWTVRKVAELIATAKEPVDHMESQGAVHFKLLFGEELVAGGFVR